jgi:hypothetical protein
VSTGYLAALAERTLGVAATLRPAAPSRFEPAQLAEGGLVEAVETSEAPAPAQRPPVESPPAVTSKPAERRLLPPVEPSPVRLPPAPSAVELPAAGVPASPAEPVPAAPPAERTPEPAPAPAPGPPDVPRGVTELARAVTALTGPFGPADQAGRRSPDQDETGPRGADRSGRGAAAERMESRYADAEPQPPLVVHIGRIEVRAIEAPRPVAPAPRPAPAPAGASLADYLLARDAGRRR